MFGYVKTDLPNMYVKDTVLYKASYCGLCKGIGKCCNTCGRFSLSYDLAFLSVFLHNLVGEDMKIERQHCILHPIKKNPIAVPDKLTERIAALNVILAYYKVLDDIADNNKGRAKRLFFSSAYKKAKKAEPKFDEIVKRNYQQLGKYEKQNIDSIDISSDPFSNLIKEIVKEVLQDKADENVLDVAYNLGKWIYLIDALDDFDKDKKSKSYNVFVNIFSEIENKKELLCKKKEDLQYVFGGILNAIAKNVSLLKYQFNHDLIDNILIKGIKEQTINIMENCKCKNTIKY